MCESAAYVKRGDKEELLLAADELAEHVEEQLAARIQDRTSEIGQAIETFEMGFDGGAGDLKLARIVGEEGRCLERGSRQFRKLGTGGTDACHDVKRLVRLDANLVRRLRDGAHGEPNIEFELVNGQGFCLEIKIQVGREMGGQTVARKFIAAQLGIQLIDLSQAALR